MKNILNINSILFDKILNLKEGFKTRDPKRIDEVLSLIYHFWKKIQI